MTSASHCDRSAFLTSSRAWFWCSGRHKRGDGEVKHEAESVVKCGTKQRHKNKGKGRERDMLPFIASLWGRIREIRQKRDSISPYQGRHITLAHPVATQQLQGSFSQPANICDWQISECVCVCMHECWLMRWRSSELFVKPSFIGSIVE